MTTIYVKVPFAESGDVLLIPELTQPDGSVSFEQGYGNHYTLEQPDPDAKDVPRASENYFKNIISAAVKELQEMGFKVWDTLVNYPVEAVTTGSNGLLYKCLEANGPDEVAGVVDPVTDFTGKWIRLAFSDSTTIAMINYNGLADTIRKSLGFTASITRISKGYFRFHFNAYVTALLNGDKNYIVTWGGAQEASAPTPKQDTISIFNLQPTYFEIQCYKTESEEEDFENIFLHVVSI